MEPTIGLAIALLLAGLFILFLELFIPSVGMLFVLSSLCIIASVWVAFQVSSGLGGAFLVLIIAMALVLPGVGFQIWKRSWIGRRMFLDAPSLDGAVEETVDAYGIPTNASPNDFLLGQIGKTLTPLRPAGATEFNGRRVDTVAEGVMIGAGEFVRVVEVQGNRVVVRKVDAELPPDA